MTLGPLDFPSALISALLDDKLIVFAGAGVSMGNPACLPNFRTLANEIAQGTGENIVDGEPEDRFLGRLETDKAVQVHARAADRLTIRRPRPTALHRNLLRLFSSGARTRVVTTNFDLLFEQVASEADTDSKLDVYTGPALPLGRAFQGVVHVHGRLDRPETMVLTDADFGRAYLIDGWARRFLVDLFRSFTVLFVGYSHGDVVMNYLARALPAGHSRRFVLTDEVDEERWARLGVTIIRFPEADFHTLCVGVGALAEYKSRGILEWQHSIREIARSDPPSGNYEVQVLADALTDPVRTRFFTASAKNPAWIDWLDTHEHLFNLFRGPAALTEPERELAHWLARTFAWDHPEEVWRIIGRHRMHVHPEFWAPLADTVGLRGSKAADATILSRWVSLLLATATSQTPDNALQYLAERCIKHNATDSLIDIFLYVTTVTLRFNRFFTGLYGDSGSEPVPTVWAELDAPSKDYAHVAGYVWKNALVPNLERVASRLIAYIVANLEAQHHTLSTWGAASQDRDPLSIDRFSIERGNHAQYSRSPEIADVLIDAARDCLEWHASNAQAEATRWCDRLAAAPAPILRRLAIHGVVARNLNADKTILWILQHTSQYDESARHERIRALKAAYPRASPDTRRAVITDVLSYRWPQTHDEDGTDLTICHQFSWLEWLAEVAPECALLNTALHDLRQLYPGFRHREFPDVDHRAWLADNLPLSRWKPDALLERPARDWTNKLLAYKPLDPLQPDRRNLCETVTQASVKNIDWGMELVDELVLRQEWDADLWPAVFRAWSTKDLDSNQYRRVLQLLGYEALHRSHAHPIADVLQAIVRNTGLTEYEEFSKAADAVALSLWASLDGRKVPEECDDWLIKAWNHPAGVLTQFWIDSFVFSKRRKERQASPLKLYAARLSAVVCDGTPSGRLGRCILSHSLAGLFADDEQWTKENLVPLIYDFPRCSNREDYLAVWDGLLGGTINPSVARILKVPFLDAAEQMAMEPANSARRKSFIECYAFMLMFFADDPVRTWTPMVLAWASEEERTFVRCVHERLENMNEVQQDDLWKRWLQQYWQNRVKGIPVGLRPRETWYMLRWLPLLTRVFPEAVDVAIVVAPNDIEPEAGRNMVFALSETDLPTLFPKHVAKLLIYLSKCEQYKNWYKGRELVDRLLENDLCDDLKTGLEELVALLH